MYGECSLMIMMMIEGDRYWSMKAIDLYGDDWL